MNPLPYLRGAPLVEVRGVLEGEREELRDRAHRLDKAIHWVWRIILVLMVILVIPLATGPISIGGYFALVALAVLVTLGVTAWLEQAGKVLRCAATSDQRWIFQGRNQAEPYRLLVPGWTEETRDNVVRRLDSRQLAWVDLRRGKAPARVDTLESQELKFRYCKLLSRSLVQLLAIIPLAIALSWAASREPLGWIAWLQAIVMFLIGVEVTRRGIGGLIAIWRFRRDVNNSPTCFFVSAAVPEMQSAGTRIPELLGSLHGIEVMPSRLLWSVDGRPASWRVQNTTPTFVPKRLVVPRRHRRSLGRIKLLPRRARP